MMHYKEHEQMGGGHLLSAQILCNTTLYYGFKLSSKLRFLRYLWKIFNTDKLRERIADQYNFFFKKSKQASEKIFAEHLQLWLACLNL